MSNPLLELHGLPPFSAIRPEHVIPAIDRLLDDNRRLVTELLERNIIIITALAPKIGYDLAADIAKTAFAENRGVREVAAEKSGLSADELEAALDLRAMTEGGVTG